MTATTSDFFLFAACNFGVAVTHHPNTTKQIHVNQTSTCHSKSTCVTVLLITLWSLCRSIGDADLKPAVTAQPEVSQHQLTAEDEFVVVASDGLWDKLSNEEAVRLVHDTVKQPTMAAQRYVMNVATLPAAP